MRRFCYPSEPTASTDGKRANLTLAYWEKKRIMQLVTIKDSGAMRLGLRDGDSVIDAGAAAADLGLTAPGSVSAAIAGGEAATAQLDALSRAATGRAGASWRRAIDAVTFGPCVPAPGKIVCVGLNYTKHAQESNLPIPTSPVLFSKFNNTLAGTNEEIPLPANAEQYDYEAELCVVIGKRARNVAEADALDYVYGYCCADDISVRELQTRTSQWLLGKTMDKHFPIGPYLVTADEVGDPQALQVTCTVNGEQRQNSNTADMIFSVAQVISYISDYFTLEPGDLITTGTPQGVAMGMASKPWLKPGDEVVVEIEKLGSLRNVMTSS